MTNENDTINEHDFAIQNAGKRDEEEERKREGGREGENGKNPYALLRCTYWSLTDEVNPHDWRRVGTATSEAPLPCRLGLLLDDHPETRLMGPVGAPEIPTRTEHNVRLKVGSTTDGKAPTDATTFKQGRPGCDNLVGAAEARLFTSGKKEALEAIEK
ncbi:hypothetical protein ALC53_03986 [Atta colombica]|uniref:Uncharacterized protein n=1 Tax=Atta colombica TaxID=520822 RepID=A0A195BLG2_9HYME|nr:hypothetical protein ALC53_03986 [Atta colombica]